MLREARVAPSDEADLIARAILKEEAAVRILIRRYNQRLYRIARSVVRDDGEAEDVVQQGYVHAFTHLAGFRGDSQFSTWITRIVLNEALGRLRRRRPLVDISAIDEAHLQGQIIQFPIQHDPERRMAQREIHTMLEQAIDELPDAFRTVLVARLIEGMSIDETAELIGIKPETVKTRLHRARQLVKSDIEKRLGSALTKAFPFDGWRCERLADAVVRRLAQSA